MPHSATAPSPAAPSVQAGPLLLTLASDPAPFRAQLTARSDETGVWLVEVRLTATAEMSPPPVRLTWSMPIAGIHALWCGDHRLNRSLMPDWGPTKLTSRACSGAPVLALHHVDGSNRLTIAGSDPLHTATLSVGVHEESARLLCAAEWFAGGLPAGGSFVVALRLDLRQRPLAEGLGDVARWWETLPGLAPIAVPDIGRLPMYSTWYTLHQAVEPAAVEAQCRLARELGCAAVIVDDGWQTLDGNRGYAFCGDWEPERIPAMAEHVGRVHALGLKYLLWYSVPFIGFKSKAYARFAGRYLREDQRMGAAVLDPRYPEVRDFLASLYERHLRAWDLDGFKLDFVDSFFRPAEVPATAADGRDIADVDEAVMRLLGEVVTRLRAIKPDILFEFRQSYIGPAMRTVGNLFRAGDCPNDPLNNRRRTLDIRLTCGATACHADMLMWHPEDPVESAALQLLNVLFSVPQISVPLDGITEAQQRMLRFWLAWWRENRPCLLDGRLSVEHPELGYTQAGASDGSQRIVCVYARTAVRCQAADPPSLQVVNASGHAGILLECASDLGRRQLVIRDVVGTVVDERTVTLSVGVQLLPVPPAGLACLSDLPARP